MNKAEFVAEVARKASITRAEAARAVDAVFNTETGALSEALQEVSGISVAESGDFTRQRSFAARVKKVLRGRSRRVVTHAHGMVFKVTRRADGISVKFNDSVDATSTSAATHDCTKEREIRELAVRVWENAEDAEEFLTTPHGLLDGQTPLAASRTEEGAKRVREILLALEYGLPV